MVKIFFKSVVRIIYRNSYYLNCGRTTIAAVHLGLQAYVPVSPVVVYILVDECTRCLSLYVVIARLLLSINGDKFLCTNDVSSVPSVFVTHTLK
jgi:hypothetical protein